MHATARAHAGCPGRLSAENIPCWESQQPFFIETWCEDAFLTGNSDTVRGNVLK